MQFEKQGSCLQAGVQVGQVRSFSGGGFGYLALRQFRVSTGSTQEFESFGQVPTV